jgi:hypothetical protein
MAQGKQKNFSDIGGPPEELQTAYKAVMVFNVNNVGELTIQKDLVDQLIEQEAGMNPLQGGDNGITTGIKSILRQATSVPWMQWLTLRGHFDAAIQPFMEKINSVHDLEEKQDSLKQKAQERENAVLAQAEADQVYHDRNLAKKNADQHFDQLMQGEGGRPINFFAFTWQYIIILISITSIEWLVNYESFFDWLRIPAISAGCTIGMAVAVGFAAHIHGEYLKQKSSRFGPASDHTIRDISFLLLATILLIGAVSIAGYARYVSAIHSIGSQAGTVMIIQESLPKQSGPLTDVVFSLGINLIVWLIGLVVSFKSHDENHEIMSAWHEQWWRTKQFNRVHKPWQKRIEIIRAQAARDIDRLNAATELAKVSTEEYRNMLDQINQREKAICRALANNAQITVDLYRMSLGKALQSNGHHILIDEQSLTGQQYIQVPLTLNADTIRELIA